MSLALLALLLLAAPASRHVPAGAAAALEAELRSGDDERAAHALRTAPMAEPGVLGVVVEALAQERAPARRAALDALGRAGDAQAYAALREHHARARARSGASTDERVELLRALGRYGRADAIDFLVADLERPADAELLRARLFGLANVRSRAAADGVFYLLNSLTPAELERSRDDLRLALVRTTGADQGHDFARWRAFWSARAPAFRPPAAPPPFSPRQAKAWRRYWGA